MAKVMVFTRRSGDEWYSRNGVITVRNSREVEYGLPERLADLGHMGLHRMVARGVMRFKELRNE